MQPAWIDESIAYQYAFGASAGRLAKRVVLLHKDRLQEVANFLPNVKPFEGRWRGISTNDKSVAFIAVPGGVADVCDCLFHLNIFPPEVLYFTGTCAGISEDIEIGSLYLIEKAWLSAGSILDWMGDAWKLVHNSRLVQAAESDRTNTIAERIKQHFGLGAKIVDSFSVPFQAVESPCFIQAVKGLGAKVLDMESATFLGLAENLAIPALCLLWCTDRPEDASYYASEDESLKQTRHELWTRWPEILAKLFSQ